MDAFLRGLIRGADPMEPDGEDLAERAEPRGSRGGGPSQEGREEAAEPRRLIWKG